MGGVREAGEEWWEAGFQRWQELGESEKNIAIFHNILTLNFSTKWQKAPRKGMGTGGKIKGMGGGRFRTPPPPPPY